MRVSGTFEFTKTKLELTTDGDLYSFDAAVELQFYFGTATEIVRSESQAGTATALIPFDPEDGVLLTSITVGGRSASDLVVLLTVNATTGTGTGIFENFRADSAGNGDAPDIYVVEVTANFGGLFDRQPPNWVGSPK